MTSGIDPADREALRESVRRFASGVVAPLASAIDREERFPDEAWAYAADMGLLGIRAPVAFGGSGLGITETCIAAEELSAVCMSTAVTICNQSNLVVDKLVDYGTEDQMSRLLPGLCSGATIGCLAITEPEAGSDAMSMRTRASRVDGGWLLNGSKAFITNAPVAGLALVYAKSGPVDAREMTLFAVDTSAPGFAHGRKLQKLGWRGSPTGDLFFEDCFVPDEDVIGEVGAGERVLKEGLSTERLVLAAQGVGLAQGALRLAASYAKSRVQFGRPIAEFQLIQAKLADIYTGVLLGRALIHESAHAFDSDQSVDITAVAAAAKLHASALAMFAGVEAVQVFGGFGYTVEGEVERFLRDAKILQIGGGTSEIQRMIIAREALR